MAKTLEYPFPEKRLGERCESCEAVLVFECGIHGAYCRDCFGEKCPGCEWDDFQEGGYDEPVDKTFV